MSHHAENTRHLGLVEILRSNFGYKSKKEIGPVVDVEIICHPEVHPGVEIHISSTSGRQYQCLVRHEKCRDRETDGAIHWKLILPKLVITFRRDGSRELIH